jgi:uncharacterized protein YrrD
MPDPVSWFVIERGWSVVGSAGEKLGTIEEVIGDLDADIFNGVTVSSGLLAKVHYVPAERVREIREGAVELALDREGFDALGDRDAGGLAT